MTYGKAFLKDNKDGSFLYYILYGRTPAGCGTITNYHYHNKRLVFETGSLYYRNIHKIEVIE